MSTKREVIEEILDHTIRKKESDGILLAEQIQHMLDVLHRDDTHSNYCDMMFEIKNMKFVINNCQQLSTTVNNTKCPRKRC